MSLKSLQSGKSKQSYFSVRENDNKKVEDSDSVSEQDNLTQTIISDKNEAKTFPTLFDTEPKMDLNFDIKRPILDSSLPKYCYLKYLSRAYVQNWNQTCMYPYYDDFSRENIFFSYRQKGMFKLDILSTKKF